MSAKQAIGDLEGLTERVLNEAHSRARATVERALAEAEQLTQEAEAKAKEQEEELVRAGMGAVERARKRIVSQAQLRLRGDLLERKAAILTDIINEVRDRLLKLRSADRTVYQKLLLSLLRGALSGEVEPGRILIYLNREDLQNFGSGLQEALRELGMDEIELREAEIAGGVIVELPERRLQFDSSLEQILQEFRPKIERLVQERVFAPLEAEVQPSDVGQEKAERGEVEHGKG
jgi:vacuolar-type H+-ATPase subunit E/Vma4